MQDEEEENDDENHIEADIPTALPTKQQVNKPGVEVAMNALGLMPVSDIFNSPKIVEPMTSIPKTQVPRLKTVPLRKINLKQPHQPIPIAPVSNNIPNPNLPKLIPRPSISLTSTPTNNQQKLPKLKLSIRTPTNNSLNSSRHSDYERHHDESSHYQPPVKSQKIRESSTPSGQNPNKQKSMKDLANNLKDMQKDLIADFFKKQQELITEEFEFQKKQDEMLLKSFEDQNRLLLSAAKNLIEQIPSNFYL